MNNPNRQNEKFLDQKYVVVIPGFQGINENMNISTIGRGGSDASAIMLAKFFKAKRCIIYTDVELSLIHI